MRKGSEVLSIVKKLYFVVCILLFLVDPNLKSALLIMSVAMILIGGHIKHKILRKVIKIGAILVFVGYLATIIVAAM
jgi:hypothetical protein